MKSNAFNKIFFFLIITISFCSCKKYLDKKSDGQLSTPSTLEDFQAMLDNYDVMNLSLDATNTLTDEYFISEADWNTLDELNRRGYVWDPQLNDEEDWSKAYKAVFYSNTILEELEKLTVSNDIQQQKKMEIKGAALLFRAFHFFNIALLYSKQYDPASGASDLGIPLRLTADFNEVSSRATIQQTYDQIVKDLQDAVSLLPNTAGYKTRPSKTVAFGMLSRVFLQLGNYEKALENANNALKMYDQLINYNDLDPSLQNPFPRFSENKEIIFYTFTTGCLNLYDWMAKVDSTLFDSYSNNDLRKALFFKDLGTGGMAFEGFYSGDNLNLFSGIATDEIYLIKAECLAWQGNIQEAMATLNKLLKTRWKEGTFSDFTANNTEEALKIILNARRQELLNRGIRWQDIKRLNKDSRFTINLKRIIGNSEFGLLPNDLRYAALIPLSVIIRAGIQQNER